MVYEGGLVSAMRIRLQAESFDHKRTERQIEVALEGGKCQVSAFLYAEDNKNRENE